MISWRTVTIIAVFICLITAVFTARWIIKEAFVPQHVKTISYPPKTAALIDNVHNKLPAKYHIP